MTYLIKEVEEATFTDFLLNPYSRASRLGDRIFQKYRKTHLADDVYTFNRSSGSYDLYARVDYVAEEIIVYRNYFFYNSIAENPPYISHYDVVCELQDQIKAKLEDMKVSRLAELKKNPKYIKLYDEYEEKYLEPMIFEMLGTTSYAPDVYSRTNHAISNYLDRMSLDEIVDIRAGNTNPLDVGAEGIFNSDNFIIAEIIIDEIKEKANTIVSTGALSYRQKLLKNMAEKTNACGATRFTVETLSGSKVSCRNYISSTGYIIVTGRSMDHVEIENVKKIIYGGKVIYEKDVF